MWLSIPPLCQKWPVDTDSVSAPALLSSLELSLMLLWCGLCDTSGRVYLTRDKGQKTYFLL